MPFPDPDALHPVPAFPQVVFLRNAITRPNIVVGDFTYYDDPDGAERFEERNVLYHYPQQGDRLVIGKFCALARGVRFIMNGANHRMSGISTYPFPIFRGGWESALWSIENLPSRGDTMIGNDVWLGYEVLVMPGVKIGDGAVVAARSVVTADIPPYAIAGGNPAKVIRRRFPEDTISALREIAWWEWGPEKISRNLKVIVDADVDALRKAV